MLAKDRYKRMPFNELNRPNSSLISLDVLCLFTFMRNSDLEFEGLQKTQKFYQVKMLGVGCKIVEVEVTK